VKKIIVDISEYKGHPFKVIDNAIHDASKIHIVFYYMN